MDKHDIMRKARAARQFSVEVAPGVSITLQLPTRQEVAVAAARAGVHRAGDETAGLVVMQRALLVDAVVGWSQGVLLCHLLPDEDAQPLPFERDLVPLLLDAQPAWEDALVRRFADERRARTEAMEAAAKNWPSASNGSEPAPMRTSLGPMSTGASTQPVEPPRH